MKQLGSAERGLILSPSLLGILLQNSNLSSSLNPNFEKSNFALKKDVRTVIMLLFKVAADSYWCLKRS